MHFHLPQRTVLGRITDCNMHHTCYNILSLVQNITQKFFRKESLHDLKAVAFTDLHLGITNFNQRIQTMLGQFANQIVRDIKPDVVMCLGDVFHTKKPSADVVEFATKFFKYLADNMEHVIILPGNHDKDAFNNTTATDFLDDITSNIEVMHEPVESLEYLFVPYMRVLTPEIREQIQVHPQVFLHQGYSDAIVHGTTKYGKKPDSVYADEMGNKKLALFGHIHSPMQKPKKHIYILGAPYQLKYSDPLIERGFACWDMEDPKSFKILPYKYNFYLQSITQTLPLSANIVDKVIKSMPSPAKNYYYQINLAVEGKLKSGIETQLRAVLADIFKEQLDSLTIVSVVPQKDRKFYRDLKLAGGLQKIKAPVEMVSLYMEQTRANFYQANPDLKDAILNEFTNIMTTVNEKDS